MKSKVDMLPGLATTPRVLLEKMIERVEDVDKLVILEMDQDGYIHIWSSEMKMGDVAWFEREFRNRFGK